MFLATYNPSIFVTPEELRVPLVKLAAKPPLKERTGWSLTSHISACVLNMACERPPRLRRFGGFAIFSYWRSHPSSGRRGLQTKQNTDHSFGNFVPFCG